MSAIETRLRTTLAVAMAGILAACQGDPPRPFAADAPTVVVQTATVVAYAPTLEFTGDIQARNVIELSFNVGGRIIERLVDVGDVVTSGQPLARIDAAQQESIVVGARAALAGSEAQRLQARTDYGRQLTLFDQGNTTRRALDQALETLRVAESTAEAARARLDSTLEGVADTILLAPASGIVTERFAETGAVMQPAQPVFGLAENGERDAVFDIYEAALLAIPEDVSIEIHLTSNGQEGFAGTLRELSPTIDPQTGTIRARIAILGDQDALPLGSTVIGRATVRPIQAVVLPASAVTTSHGRPAVWIVDPGTRTLWLREVKLLAYETERVALAGGVEPGDLVVVQGPRSMRAGQQVEFVEANVQ